jgi:hypothetical protein
MAVFVLDSRLNRVGVVKSFPIERRRNMSIEDEFSELLPRLNQVPEVYFNSAITEEQKKATLELLRKYHLTEFTREWRNATGQGCPEGWTDCNDGSCAPPGCCCESKA